MSDTELEEQLTAVLRRRAGDITTAPAFRVESVTRRGARLAPLAVAAAIVAVVLAAAGTVVSIRSIHAPSGYSPAGPKPTPTVRSTSCHPVPAPGSWIAAIGSGAISLDHPKNTVVSANADTGEFLAVQDVPAPGHTSALYQQVVVALFHGDAGVDLSAANPDELPVADPTGAIDGDWVAWGLSAPQNGNTFFKVVAYDRNRHRLVPVAQLSPAQRSANLVYLGAPVLVGHQIYWLAGRWNDPTATSLQSFDLSSRTTHSRPMPDGTELIGYRSGVAVLTAAKSGPAVANVAGTPLSRAALASVGPGQAFGVRAGVLSWITEGAYHTNRIGEPTITTVTTSSAVGGAAGDTAPLLPLSPSSGTRVLDLRTGGLIELPAGLVVLAGLGDQLIFGTGTDKAGSSGLSLVPVDQLPPVRC